MTTLVADVTPEAPVTGRSARGFRPRWPETAARRWTLRVALAMPYMVVAMIADARGVISVANLRLEQAGSLIDWGADDLSFVSEIYPPIPVAIARLLPGGALVLGFVGALCAGVVLQVLWERLHQRAVPAWLTVLLLASVGATPVFFYSSTQDLVAFIGMAFFALAIAGLLRFAVEADTEGGFQCGLAFGVAAMCDPATAVYAIAAGVAAPFVAWRRYREEPGAALATLAVVLTPTLAAFGGWMFLDWRFSGSGLHLFEEPTFLAFPGGVVDTIARELGYLLVNIAITPVFVVTAVLIARRRPLALGAHALMLLSILVTHVLGIHVDAGQGLVIIAGVAVLTVGAAPSRAAAGLLGAAAIAQIGLTWTFVRPDTMIDMTIRQVF